jgi:hypothetical protein
LISGLPPVLAPPVLATRRTGRCRRAAHWHAAITMMPDSLESDVVIECVKEAAFEFLHFQG